MKTGTETTTNPAPADWLVITALLIAAAVAVGAFAGLLIVMFWVALDRFFGRPKQ